MMTMLQCTQTYLHSHERAQTAVSGLGQRKHHPISRLSRLKVMLVSCCSQLGHNFANL